MSKTATLFNKLSASELAHLRSISAHKVIQENEYLFVQHALADKVFNLISGVALIERTSATGNRQILAFVFPGDFVGLTNSEYFEFSVKSLTEVELYEFGREKLFDYSDQVPNLKLNFQNISIDVLARAIDQIYVLGKKRAHERICFLLVQLLERMPGAMPERIKLPMTRQDVADYLGLTTETVSRSISRLKNEKVIEMPSPQELVILDLEQVKELGRMD